jgi:TRAP-type transport system periplasmic protein
MKRSTRISPLRSAMATALVCLVAILSAPEVSAQVVIKVNSVTPNSMQNSDTAQLVRLAERVEAKSGGKLKLELHYSSSLIPQDRAFDGLSAGLIDATWFTGSHFSSQVPESDVYSLPFNFESHSDFARKHFDLGLNAILDDAFQKSGIKYVSGFPSSAMALITRTKPVSTRDAMKGMKIRVFGPALAEAVERLGGSPVYVPFSELEVALDRGVADGFFTGWLTMAGSPGLRRVSKYVTWPPLQGSLGISLCMNLAKYNSLPDSLKKALLDASEEVAREGQAWFKPMEDSARGELTAAGIQFVDATPAELGSWKSSLEPIWKSYVDKARARNAQSGERAAKIIKVLQGQKES